MIEKKIKENGEHFCILVCYFFNAKWNGSRWRSRWENLDRGQYRFQPIKFVNSVVPSPCEKQPYNNVESFLACFFIYFVFDKAARPEVIYLLLTWFASWLSDLRKAATLPNAKNSGRPAFKDSYVLCHLSSKSYWYDSSRRNWEDMSWLWRLEILLRMTVAWPIGDVACDNTDSIFPPGPNSCFVYHSANRTLP